MRKLIIDSDTGSDDAVAIMMPLSAPSDEFKVEAITTVFGNCSLEQATLNALMTVEVTDGQKPPVYVGAGKPLVREIMDAIEVHGKDGMGDLDLIHPTRKAEEMHAVDAILKIVKENPGEIEIVTIGPCTNIALAISKDPETMKSVKHIWSMGSAGFGVGNVNPLACFNVYTDAEAHDIMLNAGIPCTIVGFDVCLGDSAWNKQDMEALLNSGVEKAAFAVNCNRTLLEYNIRINGEEFVDLPDAVAMGVVMWDDMVLESKLLHCHTCLTHDDVTYGHLVLFDNIDYIACEPYNGKSPNATVIKTVDSQLYKDRLHELLVN